MRLWNLNAELLKNNVLKLIIWGVIIELVAGQLNVGYLKFENHV